MGTTILDVAIGLVVVYLVLSFVCTSVNEYIAQVLSLRAENLWKAIQTLFQGSPNAEAWAKQIYQNKLVCSLSPATKNAKPSYLPADVFSLALIEELGLVAPDSAGKEKRPIEDLLKTAKAPPKKEGGVELDPAAIIETLRPLAVAAGDDFQQFRLNIERWFDKGMERATGWYKRCVQKIIFWIAFSVALLMNADTIMLVDTLWSDPKLRAEMASTGIELAKKAPVETAEGAAPAQTVPLSAEDLTAARADAMKLLGWSGPINWNHSEYRDSALHRFPRGFEWLYKVLGILITAFAASLGAPFWFDILKRIVNIRSSGNAPGEKTGAKTNAAQASNRIGEPAKDEGTSTATEEKK